MGISCWFCVYKIGMFAITKYWWSQGEMDSGLNKWGGENVDISFRYGVIR